ncbi:MAG: DUF3592 domain-containing protein [Gammaproteobacteria bacterium]|nr:DUF3592 domain-containing protein [Gammaproteobacteria bacterium]
MEGLALAVVVGLIAWMLLHSRHKAQRYRRLATRGVPVEADVLRRFERRRPKSPRIPYVEYRFATLHGETLTQVATVSRAEYERLQAGQKITVIYDPDAPSLSRPRSFLERNGYL